MPERERQRYVAYRASSDQFEIRFFGGPLDGARICTDILPDCETFMHRVRDRSYSYRYKRVSELRFHATLSAALTTEQRPALRTGSARQAVIVMVLVLSALATVTGLWQLLGS